MSEEAEQNPPAAHQPEGGEKEPESKRLKTSEEASGADGAAAPPSEDKEAENRPAPLEVHPDDEEDAAKAGGDAIPTSPISVSPNRSQRDSAHGSHRDSSGASGHLEMEAPPPPKPPAPADWRETLFVWRGAMEYNPVKRRCNWVGSWAPQITHGEGPPTDRDFETHQENQFVLHRVLDKRIDLGRATTIPEVLYGRNLSWLGFYKLDQDDGKGRQRLVDFSHLFTVTPVEPHEQGNDNDSIPHRLLGVVGAVGSNDFGNFVSVGVVKESKDDEATLTMTLARRYITNKDGRNRWKTPKEAMKELNLEAVKRGDFWAAVPTKEAAEATV